MGSATRWSTLPESFVFDHLAERPVAAPRTERFIRRSYGPLELFRISEREHWSAQSISLDADRAQWDSIVTPGTKSELAKFFRTFLIGEYTGLDLLAPIQAGSPHEDDLLFLAAQVTDEARHTFFMTRIAQEVLGEDADLHGCLDLAWSEIGGAHRRLSRLEAETLRRVQADPQDMERWIEAVTLFHLITEGLLAIHHQAAIVKALTTVALLPGIRAGFANMLTDEGRHVSYGLHALRRAVADGYEPVVAGMVERAAPLALRTASAQHRLALARSLFARLQQIGCGPESAARARAACENAADAEA